MQDRARVPGKAEVGGFGEGGPGGRKDDFGHGLNPSGKRCQRRRRSRALGHGTGHSDEHGRHNCEGGDQAPGPTF